MELDILSHFGFEEDPFADPEPFESADLKMLRSEIRRAAEGRAWLAVTGVKGAGKTFATHEALFGMRAHLIRTLGADRQHYRGANIDAAIMMDISEERMRSGREARRRQLERVLGEASRQQPIVILVDEATSMPHQLFTEIKFLRDSLRFGTDPKNPSRADRRPLFAVVMIGWPSLATRIEMDNELRPRVRRYKMQGLSRDEVHRYIEHLGLSRVCPKDVRNVLADFVRYPLHISNRIQEGMERAFFRGDKTIKVEDISRDITELYRIVKANGILLKDIAEESGMSVACVHSAVTGGRVSEKTKDRLMGVLMKKESELKGESDAAQADGAQKAG